MRKIAPLTRRMVSARRELVAFFGLQFTDPNRTDYSDGCCAAMVCDSLVWIRQVQRLAAKLARRSRRSTSVHMFTPCIPESQSSALSRSGGAPVFIHNSHGKELLSALELMRLTAAHAEDGTRRSEDASLPGHEIALREWRQYALFFLLKWSSNLLTFADAVVLLDLDTEPWPLRMHPVEQTVSQWREHAVDQWLFLLSCFQEQNHSLFSISDHASPVHGGYFLIKPNATLYAEGRT